MRRKTPQKKIKKSCKEGPFVLSSEDKIIQRLTYMKRESQTQKFQNSHNIETYKKLVRDMKETFWRIVGNLLRLVRHPTASSIKYLLFCGSPIAKQSDKSNNSFLSNYSIPPVNICIIPVATQ